MYIHSSHVRFLMINVKAGVDQMMLFAVKMLKISACGPLVPCPSFLLSNISQLFTLPGGTLPPSPLGQRTAY